MTNKQIRAKHVSALKEALSILEDTVKHRNANICFYVGSNRVEMNRMIAANNLSYKKCEDVYQKLVDHFEGQFDEHIDIDAFTLDELESIRFVFNEHIKSVEKVKDDLSSFTTDKLVMFAATTELSRIRMVCDDLIEQLSA